MPENSSILRRIVGQARMAYDDRSTRRVVNEILSMTVATLREEGHEIHEDEITRGILDAFDILATDPDAKELKVSIGDRMVVRFYPEDTQNEVVSPPETSEFLLRLFLPGENRRHIIGDLCEEYCEDILPRYGRPKATWWYRFQVVWAIFHYNRVTHAVAGLIGKLSSG